MQPSKSKACVVKKISLLIVLLFCRGLCSGEETQEKKNQEVKLETQELTKKIAANREGLGLCTAIKKKTHKKNLLQNYFMLVVTEENNGFMFCVNK